MGFLILGELKELVYVPYSLYEGTQGLRRRGERIQESVWRY